MSGNDEIDHSVNKTTEKYDSIKVNNKLSATTGNNDNEKLTSSSSSSSLSSSSSSLNENSKKHQQITAQNTNNNNNNNNNNKNGDNKISTTPSSITTIPATNNDTTITPPKPTKRSSKKTEWVQFDDEDKMTIVEMPSQQQNNKSHTADDDVAPAVLTTESVHINIAANNSKKQNIPKQIHSAPAVIDIPINTMTSSSVQIPSSISSSSSSTLATNQTSTATPSAAQVSGLRTIELSTGRVREGFANGDIIVTLLPINTKWPWITPAIFRPELVPEELMAQGLTLTVEEYVHAMETLVNDVRFTFYNVCYKRVLVCWILFAFGVLLGLLFSGLNGIALFSLGVAWLFLNAAAIFFCMWIKLRLSRGLERCLASVNKQLLRHKIILALDDRGKISCHKVNLCFMYYDPAQCVGFLNEFIERNEQNGTSIEPGWETRLDVNVNDIVIQGSSTTRVSRKQALGEELFLRYLQRWAKDFLRRRLDWIVEENGIHETPRHLQSSMCPCQYAEEILHNKPRKDSRACCSTMNNWCMAYGIIPC